MNPMIDWEEAEHQCEAEDNGRRCQLAPGHEPVPGVPGGHVYELEK